MFIHVGETSDAERTLPLLEALVSAGRMADEARIRLLLKMIVPEYQPRTNKVYPFAAPEILTTGGKIRAH